MQHVMVWPDTIRYGMLRCAVMWHDLVWHRATPQRAMHKNSRRGVAQARAPQAGPRMCLGVDMAVFEIKVLAAVLLQRHSFELAPGEKDRGAAHPTPPRPAAFPLRIPEVPIESLDES